MCWILALFIIWINHKYILCFVCLLFETDSHYAALNGLEFSVPAEQTGLKLTDSAASDTRVLFLFSSLSCIVN